MREFSRSQFLSSNVQSFKYCDQAEYLYGEIDATDGNDIDSFLNNN